MSLEEIQFTKHNAEQLFGAAEIELAIDDMAAQITEQYAEANPLLLGVMTGAVVPLGLLLTKLHFPLEVDYVHVTRYGESTSGGEIQWLRAPPKTIISRHVLVVDDILDHGITLQAIIDKCIAMGVASVKTAVLVSKNIEHRKGLLKTDFCALFAPDRYLFGYGMDYKNYWRNGDGIYAVVES